MSFVWFEKGSVYLAPFADGAYGCLLTSGYTILANSLSDIINCLVYPFKLIDQFTKESKYFT